MNAFEELRKWKRKSYRYIIDSGTGIMAGNYEYIKLTNGLRSVEVSAEDFANEENDYRHASTEEIILEAIRLWHLDDTPKHFRVYCYASNLGDCPLPDNCIWWGNSHTMVQLKTIAKNDEESMQILKDLYKNCELTDSKFFTYEYKG